MQVEANLTPVTEPEQADALVEAFSSRAVLTGSLAELCLAQLMLENAHGSAVWNYNVGNVTTADTSQPFYILANLHTDSEGHPVDASDPSAVVLRFKAFSNLADGMGAYANEVIRRKALYTAGSNGDVRGFAQAIKSTGYTPGIDTEAVARSLASEIAQIRAQKIFEPMGLFGSSVLGALVPPLPRPQPVQGAILGTLALAGLYASGRWL
jgi:hypothetical protein